MALIMAPGCCLYYQPTYRLEFWIKLKLFLLYKEACDIRMAGPNLDLLLSLDCLPRITVCCQLLPEKSSL
jgi:hypothetical protein